MQNSEVLTKNLMEQICHRDNLNRAYKRVKSNKGSAGVDGMTVDQLLSYLKSDGDRLKALLMNGDYYPKPVRHVMIPKPGGGERQLGIPTVIDRFIQQAI